MEGGFVHSDTCRDNNGSCNMFLGLVKRTIPVRIHHPTGGV